MIQVSHLTKRYGSRLAVEDVSFQVEQVELLSQQQGESCCLVHCSGDGDHRAQVSRALAQAGCPVLELSAQHKSLEEVFLQLTGTPPETTGMEAEE